MKCYIPVVMLIHICDVSNVYTLSPPSGKCVHIRQNMCACVTTIIHVVYFIVLDNIKLHTLYSDADIPVITTDNIIS